MLGGGFTEGDLKVGYYLSDTDAGPTASTQPTVLNQNKSQNYIEKFFKTIKTVFKSNMS